VGIIDLLSPEDEGTSENYNHLERLRDPSHTRALSKTQMERILEEVGIRVDFIETRDIVVDFKKWVQMTKTEPETVDYLQTVWMEDINQGKTTGMRPFMENDSLKFLQVWSVFIGTKVSKTRPN
jgi:hypothetical protein